MTQQQLAIIGKINCGKKDLSWKLVAKCKTEQEAFRLCVQHHPAHLNQNDISVLIGMRRGAFNTVINSDYHDRIRYLSREQQVLLQMVCYNNAIDQWAYLYEHRRLDCQKEEERQELKVAG